MLILIFAMVTCIQSIVAQKFDSPLIGIHCTVDSDDTGEQLLLEIPQLAKMGINLIVIEIGYCYQWKTHPELAESYFLSADMATQIAQESNDYGITVVPLINCVGHQSWDKYTDKLLSVYPEFDETPNLFPNNEGIYCRSWCTQNDDVYPIIFDLVDEITDVFKTKFIHVGLDEIFLIGEDSCPRCRGIDKGDLLARAINSLYYHCVVENQLKMFMWGDRLLDGNSPSFSNYTEWDSSKSSTYTAIGKIPKDIIICDWHYDNLDTYESIPFFLENGFCVLPTSYHDIAATKSLVRCSLLYRDNENMLGHLYTNWGDIENKDLSKWPPMLKTIQYYW